MSSFAFPRLAIARHHFVRGLVVRIFLRAAFVTALVEAVFLAERFSAIFGQGVRRQASPSEISVLLLLSSPEIFDLALAFAVLVAVYQILLRAREDRELLVMAGAGLGIYRLIGMLFGLAIFAQIASLFVSGTVGPAAQYAQRGILFEAGYRTLRDGGPTRRFYYFRDHVVFVEPKAKDAPGRHLFIRERLEDKDRLITVDDATLEGPDPAGRLSLQMQDFLAYDFADEVPDGGSAPRTAGAGATPIADGNSVSVVRAANVTRQLQLEELLTFDPRGTEAGEWTLLELLGVLPPPRPLGSDEAKSLGERAARSLLCLLAPLLATLALAFTTRATVAFALPLACLALLALNVFASTIVGAMIPLGPNLLLGGLGAGTLAILTVLAVGVVRTQHALVRPALARA